ncbi:MAG: hypothetical protein P1V35_03830 [Planctomycetota bacterium]|nr:hypothetical protein [Planctomycetota bacterium]
MLHPTTPTAHAPERSRSTQEPQAAQRVQVVERWNQWVRVRFAETGEEAWVDLAETGFSPASPEGEKKN